MLKIVIFLAIAIGISQSVALAEEVSEEEVKIQEDILASGLKLDHEIVNEQSDQPSSGEQFVAFHSSMGAREELSPTLLGLNNMAMRFLPEHIKLLSVISAHREIVAGVKYDLLVNGLDSERAERTICSMEILEKPWITNQWGEKLRELKYSNCTSPIDLNLKSTTTEPLHVNPVFINPPTQVMTEDQIIELERQILRDNKKKVQNPILSNPSNELPSEEPHVLPVGEPESEKDLDGTVNPPPAQPANEVSSKSNAGATYSISINEDNHQQQLEIVPIKASAPPCEDENPQQHIVPIFDDNLHSNKRTRRQAEVYDNAKYMDLARRALKEMNRLDGLGRWHRIPLGIIHVLEENLADCRLYVITAETLLSQCPPGEECGYKESGTNKLKTCIIEIHDCADKPFQFKKGGCTPLKPENRVIAGGLRDVNAGDSEITDIVGTALSKLSSSANGEVLELKSVERARVQTVAGKLYHIDVLLKTADGQSPRKCKLKVWYQLWISEDPVEVNGECEDNKTYTHKRLSRRSIGAIVGGQQAIANPENDLEVQAFLNDALVAYNGGAYGSGHTVGKIIRATVQIVAGTLHEIDVELQNGAQKKMCHVEVWNRSWIPNGKETKVKCEGEEEIKMRSKRSLKFNYRPLADDIRSARDGALGDEELHEHLFRKFQRKYERSYRTEHEKNMRYKVFKANMRKINELNRQEQGTAKYGVTEFSDLTTSEFKKHTGLLDRLGESNHVGNAIAEIPDIVLPESFDWRDKNVISNVKNQGSCGSCWAFSVVGNIEGLNAIKNGELQEFSEQELVDCDSLDSGCNGGLPDNAYKAIEEIGGLEFENEYPYKANKQECTFNNSKVHVRVKGAVDLPKNETQMAQWLVTNGPISIGLNANAMQFYRGGVSHPYRFLCSASRIDHGVLIVGFGVSKYPTLNKTLPYWIVKNSWGPSWGEKGYYRVYRGDNTCGINSMASSAVLE